MSDIHFGAPQDEHTRYPHIMRLQRFLARAGVASRRGSENLMTAGRVCVNGAVATELGTKVDVARDEVTVDGRPVKLSDDAAYIMLNKPAGYLTTMSDPYGRPCVAELVPSSSYPGLFPVGRLDMDTTGLLLFTTDGDLSQRLLHPSHHVSKEYFALVDGKVSNFELDPIRNGIILADGPCKPAPCRIVSDPSGLPKRFSRGAGDATIVKITLHEGRKNQVKRMLSAVHHPVLELHRASFGPLSLGNLAEGVHRELSAQEVASLRAVSATLEGSDIKHHGDVRARGTRTGAPRYGKKGRS